MTTSARTSSHRLALQEEEETNFVTIHEEDAVGGTFGGADEVLTLPSAFADVSRSPSPSPPSSNVCPSFTNGAQSPSHLFYSERFPDRRVVFLLTIMQVMGLSFALLVGFIHSVTIVLLWGVLAALLYIYIRWANHVGYNDTLSAACARGLFMGAMALSILFYYEATHGTVHALRDHSPHMKLYDDQLLSIDRFLLGWLFPDGQLSLWSDHNRFIGPTSLVGPALTELLQAYYASFFGWCSMLIVYIGLWEYFLCGFSAARTLSLETDVEAPHRHHPKFTEMEDFSSLSIDDQHAERRPHTFRYRFLQWTFWFTHDEAVYRRMLMVILAILGAFLLNYLVSFFVPAVSPRVSLEGRFAHPLSGYWFSDVIRGTLSKTDEGTYGSFPSGHVALTWVPALAALKLGYPKYGWSCLVAAVLITFSTLYLRYHYFTDVLFAVPLIVFGLYFGGIYSCTPCVRAVGQVWRKLRGQSPRYQHHHHQAQVASINKGDGDDMEVDDLDFASMASARG